jgi:uncharacterized protein YpmS
LGKCKKIKFKKRYLLVLNLAVVLLVLLLLLHKPSRYNRPPAVSNNQVSTYLTNELLPALYNGVQLGEPFDLIVTQKGINDIITHSSWSGSSEAVVLSAPEVFFTAETIVLMGTATTGGVEFVITAELQPDIDKDGLLNLRLTKVKIGTVNITPIFKLMAARAFASRLAEEDIDAADIRTRIAASIFNDEPFEPVLKLDDKTVRAEKISITNGKLSVHLVPATNSL